MPVIRNRSNETTTDLFQSQGFKDPITLQQIEEKKNGYGWLPSRSCTPKSVPLH